MISYLNECSLRKHGDWQGALSFFLAVARRLASVDVRLFRNSSFFHNPDFAKRFNSLSFPGEEQQFIKAMVYGDRYFQCWRPERLSIDTDIYTCNGPIGKHLDKSICEATEQKIQVDTLIVSLLSAPDSDFQNRREVSVTKDSTGQQIQLRGVSSLAMLNEWITEQRGYYDRTSETAPRDFQTVLVKEPHRFRPTGRYERKFSRRIYEEIETGKLFYVDEGHPGHSAHLEVFSPNNEHLGIADIDTGELNKEEKVEGRTLKL